MSSSKKQPSGWNTIVDFLTAIEVSMPGLDDSVKAKLLLTLMQELELIPPSDSTPSEEKYKYVPYPVSPPYWPEPYPYWSPSWPKITWGSPGPSTCMSVSLDCSSDLTSLDISSGGQLFTGKLSLENSGGGTTVRRPRTTTGWNDATET